MIMRRLGGRLSGRHTQVPQSPAPKMPSQRPFRQVSPLIEVTPAVLDTVPDLFIVMDGKVYR